ncbi:MAG: AAA family ATPase [Bradyrhizobium sp.]|uniref:KGGVGR-motif variant AAA ATPase n=1 Tax=Bradyrhizobium sp. TaxID=376 RepID=UPI0027311E4B|nr:AAA family ATPase [Bradyrhizobium sp.]MDP1869198.1 AAA family ATPase [Bradyrhizobium sp.]
MTIHFDDSLLKLCGVVSQWFGGELLARSAIIRDAGGRLSIVLSDRPDEVQRDEAEVELKAELGAYARPDGVIVDAEYPGAQRLLEEAAQQPKIEIGGHFVRLLDRRIVGAEWLRNPAATATKMPRIVFASLKGGVGRSTALCIAAAHLSRRGRRVLTVDFDLEAPGIGTMLLEENELPLYGTLDYLVEAGISNVDNDFITDLSGDSFLGASGARVTVIPAVGRRTLQNPENALAKIARAYLEVPQEEGPPKTITDQLSDLLGRYEALGAYDVVLIDGRSGLHETTASLILGIGAEVLLFGLDQPQTFQSYRLLIGHLTRYSSDPFDDWRDRISFVHAKASDSVVDREDSESRFKAVFEPLLAKPLVQLGLRDRLTEDDFFLEWQEPTAEIDTEELSQVQVLHILEDTRYRQFDPVSDRKILDAHAYTNSFGSLLEYIDSVVIGSDPESDQQSSEL